MNSCVELNGSPPPAVPPGTSGCQHEDPLESWTWYLTQYISVSWLFDVYIVHLCPAHSKNDHFCSFRAHPLYSTWCKEWRMVAELMYLSYDPPTSPSFTLAFYHQGLLTVYSYLPLPTHSAVLLYAWVSILQFQPESRLILLPMLAKKMPSSAKRAGCFRRKGNTTPELRGLCVVSTWTLRSVWTFQTWDPTIPNADTVGGLLWTLSHCSQLPSANFIEETTWRWVSPCQLPAIRLTQSGMHWY